MKLARCVEYTVYKAVYRKVTGDKRAHKKNIITETEIKENKRNEKRLEKEKLKRKKNKKHVIEIDYFLKENIPKKHG